jgi:amidase
MDLRMPNGYSSLGGQVIAPYDFTLDPLGSSTGSSVAGTMAYAALTIGSETSGSIIAPAYIQSMVGVKPTLGLVSRYGIIPLAPSFDTAGPIVRSVTDAALLLGVIAGTDDQDAATQAFAGSPLHGVVPDYLAALHRGALKGVKLGVRSQDMGSTEATWVAAMKALESLGATLVSIPDPQDADTFIAEVELAAILDEFKFSLNQYLAQQAGPGLPAYDLTGIILYNNAHPDQVKYGQTLLIASDATSGTDVDPVVLAARTAAQQAAKNWIDTMLDQNGLAAIVAPDLNGYAVAAAAGYPSITVPSGYSGRAPHGITFGGKAFSEAQLLALAYDYEQATRLRKSPTRVNSELRQFCPG